MKLTEPLVYEEFGLPSWLFADKQSKPSNNNSKTKTTCLVIEDETNLYYQTRSGGEQYDLLAKMLAAINLSREQFVCIATTQASLAQTATNYQAQAVLIIGEGLTFKQDNVFECPHPKDILANVQLKRNAWEVLKQIQARVV